MLVQDVVVGHASQVVADDTRRALLRDALLVVGGKGLGMLQPVSEEVSDDLLAIGLLRSQRIAVVEVLGEELLGLGALGVGRGTKGRQPLRMMAHVFHRLYAAFGNAPGGVVYQVGDQVVQHALQRLVKLELRRGRELLLHLAQIAVKEADAAANPFQLQQSGLKAVVEIGRVVGNLVGVVNQLRLQRRALVQ